MWTLERCWNIKAFNPTDHWCDDIIGTLHQNHCQSTARGGMSFDPSGFQNIHEEHLCRTERTVFYLEFITPWVYRDTHQSTGELFPVQLSLLLPSREALPSHGAVGRVFSGSWKANVAQPLLEGEKAKVKLSGDPGAPHPACRDLQSLLGPQDLKVGIILLLKLLASCGDKMKYWNLWQTTNHYNGKVQLRILEVRSPIPLCFQTLETGIVPD